MLARGLRFAVVVGVLALAYATVAVAAVGDITTFTDPAGNVDGPFEMVARPDGNLWFTSTNTDRTGRVTTGGDIITFDDPEGEIASPLGITAGLDGNLWFTSMNNARIGRITTGGDITTFTAPPETFLFPAGSPPGLVPTLVRQHREQPDREDRDHRGSGARPDSGSAGSGASALHGVNVGLSR